VGSIRETRFETTDESFTLVVVDAGNQRRELYLNVEEDGLRVVVFNQTEHALIPLNDGQAREVARWLVARVGLPPGIEFRAGRLLDLRPPTPPTPPTYTDGP
jgi:hypothetical protein